MLSMELTRDSARLISISRWTIVFDYSISPALGFFAPEEDPRPQQGSPHLLTSLPPPCLAGTSIFLFVAPGRAPPLVDLEGWEL